MEGEIWLGRATSVTGALVSALVRVAQLMFRESARKPIVSLRRAASRSSMSATGQRHRLANSRMDIPYLTRYAHLHRAPQCVGEIDGDQVFVLACHRARIGQRRGCRFVKMSWRGRFAAIRKRHFACSRGHSDACPRLRRPHVPRPPRLPRGRRAAVDSDHFQKYQVKRPFTVVLLWGRRAREPRHRCGRAGHQAGGILQPRALRGLRRAVGPLPRAQSTRSQYKVVRSSFLRSS